MVHPADLPGALRRALPDGGQGRWEGRNLIYTTHMGHDEPPYDGPEQFPTGINEAFDKLVAMASA